MGMFNTLEEALRWTEPPQSLLRPQVKTIPADRSSAIWTKPAAQTFKLRVNTNVKDGKRILDFTEEIAINIQFEDLTYKQFLKIINDHVPRVCQKASKDTRVHFQETRREIGISFDREGFRYLRNHPDEEAIWGYHLRPLLETQPGTWCIIDERQYENVGEEAEWIYRLWQGTKMPTELKPKYNEALPNFWHVHSKDEFSAPRPQAEGMNVERLSPATVTCAQIALFETVACLGEGVWRLRDHERYRKQDVVEQVDELVSTDRCSESVDDWVMA